MSHKEVVWLDRLLHSVFGMKLRMLGFNLLVLNASFLSNVYAQVGQLESKNGFEEALGVVVILNENKVITDSEAFIRLKNLRIQFPEKSTQVDTVILFRQRQLFDKIFDAFLEKHFNKETEKTKLSYQDIKIYSELLKPVGVSQDSFLELAKLNYIMTDMIMNKNTINSEVIKNWQDTLSVVLNRIHKSNDLNTQAVGFLSHSIDVLTKVSALLKPEFLKRADVMELVKQLPIDEVKPIEFVNALADMSVEKSEGAYQDSQIGFLSNTAVNPVVKRAREVMQYYSAIFKAILIKKSNNAYARSGIGFIIDAKGDLKNDKVFCKHIL